MIQSIMVNYKLNDDIHNPRYISDGMNELERNMKRILDSAYVKIPQKMLENMMEKK